MEVINVMKNISVVTTVFNEETRIENLIKCFSWSDDLIIIDKSSTDKTEEIINKYISPTIHLNNIAIRQKRILSASANVFMR
jgi:glycosyltransferase involved in cell wall biosynthesis